MLKKLAVLGAVTLTSISTMAQNNSFEKVRELGGIEEFKLKSNGLSVLLKEDHSAPVVTVMITYNVGSRNEVTGTTGATHILEHLMFKGTTNFNKAKGNDVTDVLQNLGAQMNATTWLDRTNYYENLPSEHMELAIQIEADRMKNLLLRDEDRQPEMTVVRNEFERGENSPYSALSKAITQTAIVAHPYHHSTIGWRSDIENVSIEKLREFYETYYWPDNATLTLIGDFSKESAFKYIETYFGAIGTSANPNPQVYTEEPEQEGQRRVTVRRSGQLGVVGMAFRAPEGRHNDAYALTILSDILSSGKSSRLYKTLVDSGLTTNASASYYLMRDPFLFTIYGFLTPGTEHEKVEQKVWDEINRIKNEGVTQDEVDRAVNQNLAYEAFRRDGAFSIASSINEWIAMGDWTYYVTFGENLKKVTPEDVKRVAETYLLEDKSTIGYFIPKMGKGGQKPLGKIGYSEFEEKPGMVYYREPESEYFSTTSDSMEPGMAESSKTKVAKSIKSKKINGIEVFMKEMSVENVVTVRGSITAGDAFSPETNSMIGDMVARMLDKGTTKQDKYSIAETLENAGALLNFSTNDYLLNISGRMLKKDVPMVLSLMAEQLTTPAFNEAELEKLKKQTVGSLKRTLENTNAMAQIAYNQAVYPKNHPNYSKTIEEQITEVEAITVEDLKAFHKKYYGPKNMILVFTGDIDSKVIEKSISAFKGWKGGVDIPKSNKTKLLNETKSENVKMEDKTSVTLTIGAPTGLTYTDDERIALFVGNYILGGNFAARLMSIVRDKEGLTYGIYSSLNGDDFADGSWSINGSFSPKLLDQGYESTMRELRRFYTDGISEEELNNKKSTISGQFKISLSTTGGMAGTIHSLVSKGRKINYIDEYIEKINSLSVAQVNQAIKKYMNPDHIVVVKAGTFEEK